MIVKSAFRIGRIGFVVMAIYLFSAAVYAQSTGMGLPATGRVLAQSVHELAAGPAAAGEETALPASTAAVVPVTPPVSALMELWQSKRKQVDPTQVVLDLPAIDATINEHGEISIGDLSLGQIGSWLGQDLTGVSVDPGTLDWFTQGNLQHVQAHSGAGGLDLAANGQRIPSLAWNRDSLVATAEVLRDAGQIQEVYVKAVPLLLDLDLGVTLRLPRKEGVDPIPLADMGAAELSPDLAQSLSEAEVPQFSLSVRYGADGSLSAFGLADSRLTDITGAPWTAARLPVSTVTALTDAHIRKIRIKTELDGLHLSINDKELPVLTWAHGEVDHVLDLTAQLDLWDRLDAGSAGREIADTVRRLLPLAQASNLNITAFFPE